MMQTPARQNPIDEPTPRELQTLSLLAEGKPYARIARDLNVSYKTVVNISYQLKRKMNARNLPELIRAAVQLLAPTYNCGSSSWRSRATLTAARFRRRQLPKLPVFFGTISR